MIIRWYFQTVGAHVHVRCYTGQAINMTFAKNGDLVFSVDEWDRVRDALHHAVELLPESRS